MKAENRLLPEWFDHIRSGRIRLPRFQRYEVWGQGEITGLLETVVRGLPAGATLVLEVQGEEKFASRPISGSPDPTERCREHLLDGQQRLTALWKCLYGLYEDRTYFVYFKPDEDHDGRDIPQIYGQARWWKAGIQHPTWCDNPQEVFKRRYLPVHLMRPDENAFKQIRKWCDRATDGNLKASRGLEESILAVRDLFTQFNLPYLALPASTPPDVALDVFIKLNTVSVKLSTFDVIVAKFENATGQSLRQLTTDLTTEVPQIERYTEPEELILSVATMREGYAPNQANYQKIDLQGLLQEWPELIAGVKWAIEFLEAECIFDGERLPTTVVLPVLAALHDDLPKSEAKRKQAMALVRKYLWRAFLTRRYENSVSNRSLQDLRGLRDVVAGHDRGVPIFDDHEFPLPTVEELMLTDWPKRRDTLARGILAIMLKGGAIDVADNAPVSAEHVRLRDYQHLYPYALLTGDGQMPNSECFQALNCVLMTWDLQRFLSAQKPKSLFKKRDKTTDLSREVIMDRLGTHAVPVDHLPQENYGKIGDPDDRAEKIRVDYQAFLKARAEQLREALEVLCDGRDWPEGAGQQAGKNSRAAS